MDLDAVKVELVGLAEGSLEDITDPQFRRLLNRAIDNRYEEVVEICDAEYMLEITLTASSVSNVIAVPSNFYTREDRNVWHLYESENFIDMRGGKDELFWQKGSNIRFYAKLTQNEEVHLQYSKTPTRYTTMGETFLEENALEIILSELQALYYAAIDENEPNASYANSLNQANRNAL